MKKNRIISGSRIGKFILSMILIVCVVVTSTFVVSADNYYTVRINYLYVDGSPAHDPYIATFADGAAVSSEVTNPTVNGYDPMMLNEGETDPLSLPGNGTSALKTNINIPALNGNATYTVYYVAGLSHYRARFYLQNIYDDLYTADRELNRQYEDLLGETGSFPEYLEQVEIDGFTSLFHEPDSIAADGSTVFKLYYNRNYYSVGFDLGEDGYGVEPVFAKFGTEYRIEHPKRMGYTFLGWARTDKDSNHGVYGTDWHYIDENGDEMTEEAATATQNLIQLDGDQVVPKKNTYYKAVWGPGTTSFSVIYWFEKPESELTFTDADFQDAQGNDLSEAEIVEKLQRSYSAIASKDVYHFVDNNGQPYDPEPGMVITQNTIIRTLQEKAADEGVEDVVHPAVGNVKITDFFKFNLNYADPDLVKNQKVYEPGEWVYKYDKDDGVVDFPDMSKGTSEELNGNGKYFELNDAESLANISPEYRQYYFTSTAETVLGDGTTHFNVYFRRRKFNLKFFYARERISDGTVALTNSTKNFSRKGYFKSKNQDYENDYLSAIADGTWTSDDNPCTTKLPHIKADYLKSNGGFLEEKSAEKGDYRYWYYEVEAKFNAPLAGIWLIDAITDVPKNDSSGSYCKPGSWAVEKATDYFDSHVGVGNFTIKGIYEKLGKELMLHTADVGYYTNLHYLLSWTNTSLTGGTGHFNGSIRNVMNFVYENYVELLPYEIEKMSQDLDNDGNPDGASALSKIYQGGVIERTFTNLQGESVTKWYGLPAENIISTTDSGTQYNTSSSGRILQARLNQTATDMTGFEIENKYLYQETDDVDGSGTVDSNDTKYKGQLRLDDNNTEVIWEWTNTPLVRKCTMKFFYRRREYTLKYFNGNTEDTEHTHQVKYGAPLDAMYASGENAGKYRYWWNDPVYYLNELRDHYSFGGWYYTPYFFTRIDPSKVTMPATDLTLYAKWDIKQIDVVFYNNYNEYYQDMNRIVLGEDAEGAPITKWTVDYGDYVPLRRIPADTDDEGGNRPMLTPIADGANFAGWYYISNRTPYRMEPENVPIIAMNTESTGENATLKLFAEWVTKEVAKYKVSYVRADDPTVEVAPPTTGRAYVTKTRTFTAKSGDELSDEYKWTEEHEDEGTNWWPTIPSHSFIVDSNTDGMEYAPNEYTFEYIQKDQVHYLVQYLDANTHLPLAPEVERISTHASIKEDAKVIPTYISDPTSQTLILSASAAATPEEQKAEELRNNVITFLYSKNTTEYVYEVEYYTADLGANTYSLNTKETLTVPIATVGDTTVTVTDLFNRTIPRQLADEGFVRAANTVTYTYVDTAGETSAEPIAVADNGTVTIVDTDKKTIRLYFDRKSYPYSYQYIDHTASRAYQNLPEDQREGKWDGVMATFTNAGSAPVDSVVTIPAAVDYIYDNTAYTRMTNSDGTLNDVTVTIQPDEDNSDINLQKIYYRKDIERDLEYRMVCVNDNPETDYDALTGDPLFGRLTVNRQTVDSYDDIGDVKFFDTNNEKITDSNGQQEDLHLHQYTFLGWYTSPNYNKADPAENRLTTNTVLSKTDLGTYGELPDRNACYYALVQQEMVQMDVDFYFCDSYTKTSLQALEVSDIESLLRDEIDAGHIQTNGEYGGKKTVFTSPGRYVNHTQIAWHKSSGYSLYIGTIDKRVYKYEFAEWWEINKNGDLIPKDNWNGGGEWSAESLSSLLDRQQDHHLIAVYTRREVTEMPYTISYNYISRDGDEKSYIKTGVLTGDALNEKSASSKITADGDYRLTEEFIMQNAPYESNYSQTLMWTDAEGYLDNASKAGAPAEKEGDPATVDTMIATVTAKQDHKTAHVYYRTQPSGAFTEIAVPYGANFKTAGAEALKGIVAPETCNGDAFSYWAVRKSEDDSSAIIAKSFDTLFDLCIMGNYYLTPVYESGAGTEPSNGSAAQDKSVVLTHLDYNRNRWGTEGEITASTDILFTDFEIACLGFDSVFQNNPNYHMGVVFEVCATIPANKTFNPTKDYNQVSDPDNLSAVIISGLTGSASGNYVYNPSTGQQRSYQISYIPNENMTNHNRVEYSKGYMNASKNGTYTTANYLMKATAFVIEGEGNEAVVTLSNPVYICLRDISQKVLAADYSMTAYAA